MTKHTKKEVPDTPLKKIALKALLIAFCAVLMGAMFIAIPLVVIFLMPLLLSSPYNPVTFQLILLYIGMATLCSLAVGTASLRTIAKANWTASIAAPIIAFSLFFTYLITLLIVSGLRFPTEFFALGCLLFTLALIFSTILLDRIGKHAYIFAIAYLIAFSFWIPTFIQGGAIDLRVDNQARNAAIDTKNAFKAYSPNYVPRGYRLAEVEGTSYKNISYSLNYSTGNMFNPYNSGGKTFSIVVDSGASINPPTICDYEITEEINRTEKPISCEKVADTKACTLYVRHWEPFRGEKHTAYYCKIENTRLKMFRFDESMGQDEIIKIFDSLRPGISRP